MATTTATDYQHLEPRPGSNYRQLFLKGRRIRAAVVHEAVHGPDPYTPEEFASDYDVPLDAVIEALDYAERNRSLIEAVARPRGGRRPSPRAGPARSAVRVLVDENMSSRRLATRLQAAGHEVVLATDVGLGFGQRCTSAEVGRRRAAARADAGP